MTIDHIEQGWKKDSQSFRALPQGHLVSPSVKGFMFVNWLKSRN